MGSFWAFPRMAEPFGPVQPRGWGPVGWHGAASVSQEGFTPLSSVLQVSGYIYSGSTGHQIGHRGSLGVGGTSGSLLHVTRMGAHYILFPCGMSCLPFPGLSLSRKPRPSEKADWGWGWDRGEAYQLLPLQERHELVTDRLRNQRVSAPKAQGGHLCPGSRAREGTPSCQQQLEALLCFQQQAPSVVAL